MVIISKMRLLVAGAAAASMLQGASSCNSCALTQSLNEETGHESLALLQKHASFPFLPLRTTLDATDEDIEKEEAEEEGDDPALANLEGVDERTEDGDLQADSIEGAMAPTESIGEGSAPAEGTGEWSAPAASTGDWSAPAESTGEWSAPAASTGDWSAPAESTEQGSAPAVSTGEWSAPAESTEQGSAPAGSTEEWSAPAESTEQGSAPAGSTGEWSAPAESTEQGSAAAGSSEQGAAPYESQSSEEGGSAPAELQSTEAGAAPAESADGGSAPADFQSTGEGTAPTESSEGGSVAAPPMVESQNAGEGPAPVASSEEGASWDGSAPADSPQPEQGAAVPAGSEGEWSGPSDSTEEGSMAADSAEADHDDEMDQYLIRDDAKMVQWSRKQKGMINKHGLNTTKLETCAHEMAEVIATMKHQTSEKDIKKHMAGNNWAIHREMFEFLGQMAEKELSELDAKAPGKVVCETGFRLGTTVVAFTCISGATQVRSYSLRESEENTQAVDLISQKYPDSFVMVHGQSEESVRDSIGVDGWLPCNVAFINGGKTFDTVQSDIQNFAKWATPGALVMLDGCNIDNENNRRGARLAFDKAVHDGIVKEPGYITGVTRYNKTVCFGRFTGQEAESAREELAHSSWKGDD